MASVFKVVGVNHRWSLFRVVVRLGADQFGSARLGGRPTWVSRIGADLGQPAWLIRFGGRRPPALMFGGGRRSAVGGGRWSAAVGGRRSAVGGGRRSAVGARKLAQTFEALQILASPTQILARPAQILAHPQKA